MFRYVALTWSDKDRRATAAAWLVAQRLKASSAAWHSSMDVPGLMVLHADARPGSSEAYVLPSKMGVVLGKLFEQHVDESTGAAKIVLDVPEALLILSSAGRRLIEHYWGRYVAFLHDAGRRRTWVLRDPTGDLPCFTTSFQGVKIYFSHAEDCTSLGLLKFSPNWTYIAAFMCYPTVVQSSDTGLNGVSEVQAGECWEVEADTCNKRSLYWNPIDIARSNPIENLDEAVKAIRRTTQMCVWAWAQCFPRIVHLLSGGLDSSIVLSCLHTAPSLPGVTCLNYFDSWSLAGDEREYARLTAKAAGFELIETEQGMSAAGLETVLKISKSVKPYLTQYYVCHSQFEGHLAREKEASALFYGNGGDQIFYQNPMVLTAADYAYRHGFRRELFRLAAKVAHSERVSIWSVLGTAIRGGALRSRWDPLASIRDRRMFVVAPGVLEAVQQRHEYLVNPWLKAADGLPWGKLEHIRMVWSWRDFYDPLAPPDFPQRIRPLVSQPLIELCLRIPTYVLAADGWDRAVARCAFTRELPRRIVTRRAKGVIDSSLHHLLRNNWGFIRDLMLDGLLVKEGLLDRRKLEEVFNQQRASLGPGAQEIVVLHLSTEAWLRSWAGSPQVPMTHGALAPTAREARGQQRGAHCAAR